MGAQLRIHTLTFITEALRLSGGPSVASTPCHLSLLWQAFMTHCVNKATPIRFINGKCHIKQLKAGKSHKICLTNHTQSVSHHIMPLVINTLGSRQTHTNTHIPTYRHANQSNFKKLGV